MRIDVTDVQGHVETGRAPSLLQGKKPHKYCNNGSLQNY
jgi:hypothetical protein